MRQCHCDTERLQSHPSDSPNCQIAILGNADLPSPGAIPEHFLSQTFNPALPGGVEPLQTSPLERTVCSQLQEHGNANSEGTRTGLKLRLEHSDQIFRKIFSLSVWPGVGPAAQGVTSLRGFIGAGIWRWAMRFRGYSGGAGGGLVRTVSQPGWFHDHRVIPAVAPVPPPPFHHSTRPRSCDAAPPPSAQRAPRAFPPVRVRGHLPRGGAIATSARGPRWRRPAASGAARRGAPCACCCSAAGP